MQTFWKQLLAALAAGRETELVTVLAASGSTPRGTGAVMAVWPDGASAGTIGGGNVEFEAVKLARALLKDRADDLRQFRFLPGDAASLGMVCGGDVTLQFQYLAPGAPAAAALDLAAAGAARGERWWLVRQIRDGRVTAAEAVGPDGSPSLPEELFQARAVCCGDWISLPVSQAGTVHIFGGGHISQALVPVLAAADFRVWVYDDRPEFTDAARFPQADGTALVDFARLSDSVSVTPEDYVVIMTRGHQADHAVLSQVLRSGAKYLGCIGSRKKLALCRERLLADGYTAEEFAAVHAPIGLSIGAETPAEIAVSIAAEMIAVRAGAVPGVFPK